MITIFLGGAFKIMASLDVITCFLSGSIPGNTRGRPPVAIMIFSALRVFFFLPFST